MASTRHAERQPRTTPHAEAEFRDAMQLFQRHVSFFEDWLLLHKTVTVLNRQLQFSDDANECRS